MPVLSALFVSTESFEVEPGHSHGASGEATASFAEARAVGTFALSSHPLRNAKKFFTRVVPGQTSNGLKAAQGTPAAKKVSPKGKSKSKAKK